MHCYFQLGNIYNYSYYCFIIICHHNVSFQVVRNLLKGGADPNLASRNGWTPLMAAANQGDAASVAALLAAGADAAARSSRGSTALRFAAGAGHMKAVRRLLEYGTEIGEVRNTK